VSVPAALLFSVLWSRAAALEGEAPEEPPEAAGEPEGGAGVSPVELIPRVELRQSFARTSSGADVNVATTELDLQLFPRMLLRYELPLQVVRTAGGQVSGLGDVKLSTLFIVASNRTHLLAALAGVVLDTASQAPLGEGKKQITFGVAGAMKPRPWWLIYGVVQEQLSVGGDDARPDINQLVMDAGSIVFGRRFTWFKLDLAPIIDFSETRGRLFGTFEVGSLLVGRVGLFVRSGTQLVGQRQLDYSLAAGVRYLFRLGKSKPV
jgi:hypothetical protein